MGLKNVRHFFLDQGDQEKKKEFTLVGIKVIHQINWLYCDIEKNNIGVFNPDLFFSV